MLRATCAGFVLLSAISQAATTVYNPGDLFIGFRQAGNNTDYLVNIGSASGFTGASGPITLSIGDIATDLSSVFGNNWATDATLSWGIFGGSSLAGAGSDPARTLYASRENPDGGTATAWNTAASQGTTDGKIQSVGTAYAGKESTVNSSVGLIQTNIGTSANNAYGSYQPGGVNAGPGNLAFGYFNPSIEGNDADGITDASLALFRLQQGPSSPGSLVGSFSIGGDGTVTFSPVPEPSAMAVLASAAGLLVFRRRKPVNA